MAAPSPSGKKSRMTFQQIAARLPKDKLKRLAEIKKAYPHIPLDKLPDTVKREVQRILQIAINAQPAGHAQSSALQKPGVLVSPDFNKLFSVIGTDLKSNEDVVIYQKDRTQGLYIIGTSGTGKSTLLAHLILNDIKQGLGVCLIEPHGDLTNTVLAGIPDTRLPDVIYLDMTDSQYPFGLNLFQCPEPRTIDVMAKTASFVHHVFEKLWGAGTDTPRLMQVLRALTRTLMENPGTTFAEIPLLFSNDTVRAKMVANLKNDAIVSFWDDFNTKSSHSRENFIESTKNKVMSFLDEPMIRNIVAQSETTINFRTVMDSGKILLVKLSPQFKEVSLLIGAIIIGKLLMAAWSREDTDEERRRQFNLYCDEYQWFATTDLKSFIDEARKFRVAITLSHQALSQLDEENREAATGAANMIVFSVNGDDGEALAKSFDTTPTQVVVGDEPIRGPISNIIGHLVNRGHIDAQVTRFAQRYLQNLESFIEKKHDTYTSVICTIHAVTGRDILKGRELLNGCLYRCMDEKSANFIIPPLALYILAMAQGDGSEEEIAGHAKFSWELDPPVYFQGFKETADAFGHPGFVADDFDKQLLAHRRVKAEKAFFMTKLYELARLEVFVQMIRELRYTMDILTKHPSMVDSGHFKQKKQDRQYSDMKNEIANKLTQRPDYQAKVKMRSGEYDIRTNELSGKRTGRWLTARIDQVKAQMRAEGYCRHYLDVEKDIRERQDKWKGGGVGKRRPGGPPPTHV